MHTPLVTSSEVTTSTSAVASEAGTGSLGQQPRWTIDGMLIGAVWARSAHDRRATELAARTLALPDAQSVKDLTALLTSAGER